jgi:predicted enzyme related to lactoylglutathione lyase
MPQSQLQFQFPKTVPNAPSHWMPYVLVDNIDTSTEKAKSLGGTVAMGPMDVPGHGRVSIIIDPTGAALGMWQAGD